MPANHTAPPETGLSLNEATGLAAALAGAAAEASGTRMLLIKGESLAVHDLRPPRTSADIDVLIEPAGFDRFCAQLHSWGWRSRLGDRADFLFPIHSVTFVHDEWPCDIDVHRNFPGFLRPSEAVFEALWQRRHSLPRAAQGVLIPNKAGSVLVMALHAVRSTPANPRHADELNRLLAASGEWPPKLRGEIAELAVATGCVQALREVWPRLGLEVGHDLDDVPSIAVDEWRRRIEGKLPSVRVWWRYVAAGTPHERLGRVRDALWLPEEMIRGSRQVPDGRFALTKIRLQRLVGGIRQLPQALRSVKAGGPSVLTSAEREVTPP